MREIQSKVIIVHLSSTIQKSKSPTIKYERET